jgi:glycosyltransferase involved in cell wall biosynthesis
LPSLGECFGIASVEAMAAGLPVVATNVGGAADIVDDGHTGFLIDANSQAQLTSSLNRLLDDATLRTTMGQRGRRKAEHVFDGVANARAVMRCLHEAAAWSPSLSQVERTAQRVPHRP